MALNVLKPDLCQLGGVAPMCLFDAKTGEVETITGLGWWPKSTDYTYFANEQSGRIPRGVRRCVIPAAADAWLTALEYRGTMTFAEVAAPAIDLAENGFAMHTLMHETLSDPQNLAWERSWPGRRPVLCS